MKRRVLSVIALLAGLLAVVMPALPAAALTTVAQIAPGGETSCAVMSDGSAYCWGDNTYGQMGDGTTTSSATPVLVSGGHTWASISTNEDTIAGQLGANTCGVTTTGVGYCWGDNAHGEVGDATNTQRTSPTAVAGGHTWASIVVGLTDTCGITTTGDGYCWGANWHGEIGDGTISGNYSPTAISGGLTWSSLSEGQQATCGVTTTGDGYCWGANWVGALGNGTTSDSHTPTAVSGAYTWASISIGYISTCGVTTSGTGYCWGSNSHGEVGDGTTVDESLPTSVAGGYTWAQISQGGGTACGITTSGATYCWGNNAAGEVGDGTTTERHSPTLVLNGLTFSSVIAGDDSLDDTDCGLAKDGIVYCWGNNNDSQIGDGTTTNRSVPTEASLLFAATSNTNLSVSIQPTLTFTVIGDTGSCDGYTYTAGTTSTATAVNLGNVGTTAAVAGQGLYIATNAANGWTVYVRATGALVSSSHTFADVPGTNASPAAFPASGTEAFGYHTPDLFSATDWANFTTTDEPIWTHGAPYSGGWMCFAFGAQTSTATPAGSYNTTVIYTAVPTF